VTWERPIGHLHKPQFTNRPEMLRIIRQADAKKRPECCARISSTFCLFITLWVKKVITDVTGKTTDQLSGKSTRKAMCLWRYIEACLCNHCCSGRAISIRYSECGFVALGIQHGMSMRRIVICGMSGSTTFSPHYFINGKIFRKTLLNVKCVSWFSPQICVKNFSL